MRALNSDIVTTNISKTFTLPSDGQYQIKIRNGGFNSWNGDYESTDARFQNLIIPTTEFIAGLLLLPKISKCDSSVYNAIRAASSFYKNALNGPRTVSQFVGVVYDCSRLVISSLKIVTDCGKFQETKVASYLKSVSDKLAFLKWINYAGTLMNASVFGVQYYHFPSSRDTTITIGNPIIVGSWKMSGNTQSGVDIFNIPVGTCVNINGTCVYSIPNCVRDDITTFSLNGNGIHDDGPTKCSPNDPQQTTFSYTLNSNQTQVNIVYNGSSVTYNILTLNATTLKIQQVNTTKTETYTRQ